MKTSILISAIVACALSAPIVSAQERPAPVKPAMGVDVNKSMNEMQTQMDKIKQTNDPKDRKKLMQEHMQTMQENMKAMRGMGGSMKDGAEPGKMAMGDKKGGMMMGDKKGDMKDGDMKERQAMSEKRMDMMQMMMEQMMQRDQAMQSMPHM